MARTNIKTAFARPMVLTHNAAPAHADNPARELRRAVLGCLLWEDTFYESGVEIAQRIGQLCQKVDPLYIAELARDARHNFNLRHVPLLLLVHLAKRGSGIPHLVQDTVVSVIKRADELAELLAVYWKLNPPKNGKRTPLPNQFKKGLARAFNNFDAYQLAKYNRDNDVKLRDVAFLVHPNPKDSDTMARLVNKDHYPTEKLARPVDDGFKKLTAPDTWEVALSAGSNKKETFTRLLQEGKLGYLALLRNLRNMDQAGVDDDLIRTTILARKGAQNVLPFRYITAARHVKRFERWLDQALVASVDDQPQLKGKTIILVDVSGSMDHHLAGKTEMKLMDAAATLASVFPAENLQVFSFSNQCVEVPPRRGIAGVEAILTSQSHGGTNLGDAVQHAINKGYDRLVVFTDEQASDRVPQPKFGKNYMVNVAPYKPSVAYDSHWVKVEGFSDSIIRYIVELEREYGF